MSTALHISAHKSKSKKMSASPRPGTPVAQSNELSNRLLPDSNRGCASPVTNELLIAARKGYSKELERILGEKGSAVATSTLDRHGRNCLHLASHYGQLQCVSVILQMEVLDINCTSKRGFTPLHEASAEGHLSVVLYLLAMGAYDKARSKEGWTALMSTCYNGHYEIARALIAIGLDINATNTYGFTALHVAAWKGNTSVLELLIKEGAVINMETTNGKTALDIAKEERQHEAVTILQAAGVRESEKPFLRIAALENQLRVLQDKLKQIHEQHNKALAEERKRATKEADTKNEQFIKEQEKEIDQLKKAIKTLEQNSTTPYMNGLHHEDDLIDAAPEIKITDISPPKAKMMPKKKKDQLMIPANDSIKMHRGSIGSLDAKGSPLLKSLRHKTSSEEALDKLGIDLTTSSENDILTRRSFDSATQEVKGEGGRGLTITQLVEDNFQKPGSMAAIRMQIKADGLTPKINRKFKRTLPSMPEEMSMVENKDK